MIAKWRGSESFPFFIMAITGPIALFNNFPINADYYQPSQFFISTISLGITTTVTTTVDHNYVIGQLCRLIIPSQNGCRQLNESQGYVLSIPASDQVELGIYSTSFDPFVTSTAKTQPQILAVGDVNSGQQNANGPQQTTTYVQGSFINISPN